MQINNLLNQNSNEISLAESNKETLNDYPTSNFSDLLQIFKKENSRKINLDTGIFPSKIISQNILDKFSEILKEYDVSSLNIAQLSEEDLYNIQEVKEKFLDLTSLNSVGKLDEKQDKEEENLSFDFAEFEKLVEYSLISDEQPIIYDTKLNVEFRSNIIQSLSNHEIGEKMIDSVGVEENTREKNSHFISLAKFAYNPDNIIDSVIEIEKKLTEKNRFEERINYLYDKNNFLNNSSYEPDLFINQLKEMSEKEINTKIDNTILGKENLPININYEEEIIQENLGNLFSLDGQSNFARKIDESYKKIEEFSSTNKYKIIDQIKISLENVSPEKHNITLNLYPEELGKLEIELKFENDLVKNIDIGVSNKTSYDLIQNEINSLKSLLNDIGFEASKGQLNLFLNDQQRKENSRKEKGKFGKDKVINITEKIIPYIDVKNLDKSSNINIKV